MVFLLLKKLKAEKSLKKFLPGETTTYSSDNIIRANYRVTTSTLKITPALCLPLQLAKNLEMLFGEIELND